MTLDIKHWILSHLIWVVAVAVALVAFHSWRQEHDARLTAEASIKAAQAQVQTLQQQIATRDSQTQAAVAPIIKIIHDVQTVPQAMQALPQVLNQPLPVPVIPQPDNAVLIPAPDILPLFNQVADDKVCRQLFDTSQKDLVDEKAIIVQKDAEIVALAKKPGFWHRVKSTLKTVGVGIGIGIVVAKFL